MMPGGQSHLRRLGRLDFLNPTTSPTPPTTALMARHRAVPSFETAVFQSCAVTSGS
jgi:hypothetical protein